MSNNTTTIDRRVVEMQFKNDQFESNVQTSLNTIDKLKKSLKLESASQGLDGLSKSIKNVDFSAISNSLDMISSRFSTMGIMGMTVISRLTNAALDYGKQMLNSLAIAPIKQGFSEYELQMNSVQTIMAGTGASVREVNKYLDELNTYADQTIYSFSDMTQNIGKFTNAGVSLDKAVSAIKGVSNVAAVSGANANEASRAMYNFAQALSTGSVKLIDWKSIELANMGTKEFKEQLMQTAVELGTLTKAADGTLLTVKENDVTFQNFRETLKDEWLTTDVLIQTLNKYSDVTTDIGKKASDAATQVKTFSQLMDTLKEAAGSGWAKTWQILVGDFEEAKELFTGLSDVVGGFIGKLSDARNNLLEGVFGDISKVGNKKFHELYDSILGGTWADRIKRRGGVLNTAVDTRLFVTELRKAGVSSDEFTNSLMEILAASNKLIKGEDGLYYSNGKLIESQQVLNEAMKNGWLDQQTLADTMQSVATEEVTTAKKNADILVTFKDEFIKVAKAHGIAVKEMETDTETLSNLFSNGLFTEDMFDEVIAGLEKGIDATKQSVDSLEGSMFQCGMTFDQVKDLAMQVIRGDWGNGADRYKALGDAFGESFYDNGGVIQSYVDYLIRGGEASDYFWYSQLNVSDAVKANTDFTAEQIEALKQLRQAAKDAGMSLEDYMASITRPSGRELMIDSLKNIFGFLSKIGGAFKDAFRDIFPKTGSEPIYQFIKRFKELTDGLKNADGFIDNVKRSFRGLFAVIDIIIQPIKFLVSLFGNLISMILPPLANGVSGVTGNIGDMLTALDKAINSSGFWNTALEKSTEFLGKVVGAIKTLVGWAIDFVTAIGDWITGNKSLSDSMEEFTKKSEGYVKVMEGFERVGNVFLTIGRAIGWFGQTVWNGLKWVWNLPFVQTNITRFADAFSKFGGAMRDAFTKGNTAKAMGEFIERVKAMDKLSFDNVIKAVGDFFKNVVGTLFKDIGTGLSPVGKAFSALFDDIKNAILRLAETNPVIATIVDIFTKIKDFIFGFFTGKEKSSAQDFVGALKNSGGALEDFNDRIGGVKDSMGEGLSQIANFITENFGAIIAMVAGFVGIKGIMNFGDVLKGLQDLFTGLGGVIRSFSSIGTGFAKVLKATSFRIYTQAILDMVKAVAAIAAIVVAVSFIPTDQLEKGLVAVGVMAGIIGGLMLAMILLAKKTNRPLKEAKDLFSQLNISAIIMSLGTAMMEMAIAMRIMSGVKNVDKALGLFATSLLGLIAVIFVIGKMKNTATIGGGVLVAFASSLILMAIALKMLGGMNVNSLIIGMSAISVLIGEMLMVMAIMADAKNNAGTKMAGVLISFGVSLLLITASIKALGGMKPEQLILGVGAMSVLILEMMGIMAILAHGGDSSVKAGITLIGMGVSLLLISKAIGTLGTMSPSVLAQGSLTVAAYLAIFSVIILFVKANSKHAAQTGVMLLAMSAALIVMSGAIYILGSMQPEKVIRGTAAVGTLIAAMSLLVAATSKAKEAAKTLVVMTACVIALGIIVAALSTIEPVNLLSATAAISAIMIVMALTTRLVRYSRAKPTTILKTLLPMLGVVAAIGGILALMTSITVDADAALKIATGISEVLVVVTGVLAALVGLTQIPGISESAIEKAALFGSLAIDTIIGIVGGLATLLGVINDFTNGGLADAINSGLEIMVNIAHGIGDMIGNFIGGIGEGISDSLPAIGTNLSSFAKNAKGFFDIMNGVKDGTEERIASLVAAVGVLTASNFIYSLTQWFGGTDFETFGKDISKFSKGIGTFIDTVGGLNKQQVSNVKIGVGVVKEMTEALSNIPSMGNIFEGFKMAPDMVSEQMGTFAQMLKDFSNDVSTLDDGAIEHANKATDVLVAMTGMAGNIEKSGGIFEAFTGKKDFAGFGKDMCSLVSSIASVSAALQEDPYLTDSNLEKVQKLAEFIQPLVDMGNSVNASGGALQALTGEANLGEVGEQLTLFGEGLASFAPTLRDIRWSDWTWMQKCVEFIDPLIKMGNGTNASGGFLQYLLGESNLGSLGQQLAFFGVGLTMFAQACEGMDYAARNRMQAVIENCAIPLVELGNTLNVENDGGFISFFTGDNGLDDFGNQLGNFGTGLATFATNTKDMSTDKYKSSLLAIQLAGTFGTYLSTDDIDTLSALNFAQTGNLPGVMENIGKGILAYGNSLDSLMSTRVENASQALDDIKDAIDIAAGLTEQGVDLSTFADSITTLGTNLKTFATDCGPVVDKEDDINSLCALLTNLGTSLQTLKGVEGTDASTAISNLSSLVDVVEKVGAGDTSGLQNFVDGLGKVGTSGLKAFANAFNNSTTVVNTAMVAMVTSAISTLQTNIYKFNEQGREFAKKFAAGIKDTNTPSIAIIRVCSQIVTQIRNYWGPVYQAGLYIGQGLADGMRSKTDEVKRAAADLATGSTEAINLAAKVASPSKETIRTGRFIAMGLGVGLRRFSDLATKPASQVAQSALDAIADPMYGLAALIDSGLDFNPVITPVIDTSMIETGIGQINGMFNSSRIMGVDLSPKATNQTENISSDLRSLVSVANSILNKINQNGDIYLDEKTIIGRINRRLGTI